MDKLVGKRIWLALVTATVSAFITVSTQAEMRKTTIYQSQDSHGRISFSDQYGSMQRSDNSSQLKTKQINYSSSHGRSGASQVVDLQTFQQIDSFCLHARNRLHNN